MASTQADGVAALCRAGALETSITQAGDAWVGLVAGTDAWEVLAWAPAGGAWPPALRGEATEVGGGKLLRVAAGHEQAQALRAAVPWLRPQLAGSVPRTATSPAQSGSCA